VCETNTYREKQEPHPLMVENGVDADFEVVDEEKKEDEK